MGIRHNYVILGEDKSKTKKIKKKWSPQRLSTYASTLDIYISNMPITTSMKLGYADNWVLAYQSDSWEELKKTLSEDTTLMKTFFDK